MTPPGKKVAPKLPVGAGKSAQIGGKGSMRRKVKVVHKKDANEDKKLQVILKKIGCNPIGGIESVDFFQENGNIIQIKNPQVQAAPNANTFVVTGAAETKSFKDLLPELLQQMGARGGFPGAPEEDDAVPDLVSDASAAEAEKVVEVE
mmetsp:Transcript_18004/g.29928  ORF Transcript_18004/g.29928 Transcript_18004/m.29928 type:complete len:148 (+) Transcript_18004:87-530(+)